MVMKECCSKCGFPKDIERRPVLLTDSIISILECERNTCKECGHQIDGSTIPVVYDLWQGICRKFIKEREDLVKFLKHYNFLTEEQRKEVCMSMPRFMRKGYKTPKDKEMDHGDVQEPYSWNVVYLEVIMGTSLARVMVRDIDWKTIKEEQ